MRPRGDDYAMARARAADTDDGYARRALSAMAGGERRVMSRAR